jgi:dephospho-CoA kinase
MGSGKSAVASILSELGYAVLDADQVARESLRVGSPGEAEVLKLFGPGVVGAKGELDRRALGQIVFNDPEKLLQLERLVHPFVRAEIAEKRKSLATSGHKVIFYDVPLLFEKKMESDFDLVLVVTATAEVCKARIKIRSSLTDEEIESRWKNQVPQDVKASKASVVIKNDGDLAHLRAQVVEFLKKFKLPLPPPT